MRRITRTIKIHGKPYKIWLALAKKRYNRITIISLMYFIEDPKIKKTPPIKIKEGFTSEKEAIEFGIDYMRKTYYSMANLKEKKDEEIDWDDIK